MITDKELLKDKAELQDKILKTEGAISAYQSEMQNLQSQIVRFYGALDYIEDNLKPKPKGG